MADREGQQLGHYRLAQQLGAGGFAEVYLAEHRYLHTQVAIKVLPLRLTAKDQQRFLREAQTIARLRHPHIVQVFDFGPEGGAPYLVMDYAPGGTLRARHPRGTWLAPATILAYVRQIADAVQYAHEQHLIHRDLKPENLLLGRAGEVLLSDFGIAAISQTTSEVQTQGYAGTATYAAPEQLRGKPVPASDQYALGVLVYEWLSGAPPLSWVAAGGGHPAGLVPSTTLARAVAGDCARRGAGGDDGALQRAESTLWQHACPGDGAGAGHAVRPHRACTRQPACGARG